MESTLTDIQVRHCPPFLEEGWDCLLKLHRCKSNNRLALELVEVGTGDSILMATVNLKDEHMDADEVAIRDYSENGGTLATLIDAGIVERPHRSVQSGFVLIPVCRLAAKVQAYVRATDAAGKE